MNDPNKSIFSSGMRIIDSAAYKSSRHWQASLIFLLGASGLSIALLVTTLVGVADPHPMGHLVFDDGFSDVSKWKVAFDHTQVEASAPQTSPFVLSLPEADRAIFLISPFILRTPFTVEASLRQTSGSDGLKFGLWIGEPKTEARILVGVNSRGYLGITDDSLANGTVLRDWQQFPHVRSFGEINRLRVDWDGIAITVRMNDEIGGQFAWKPPPNIQTGIFVQSSSDYGGGIVPVRFQVWMETPSR